ncbi:uncharacterized protein LOC143187200 isoform X2 [Calliopsis andreniformis]|uniref:uncharacterized protein LOC143187200 isoform X2 n=1 Tax=Calliopsis andreniformis TaxID=337506 RepID=UPI003FCECD84
MEPVDEVQIETVKEPVSTINLSSSVTSEPNTDDNVNEDVLSKQNISKDSVDNVTDPVASITECTVKSSIDVDHELEQDSMSNDLQIDMDQSEKDIATNEEDETTNNEDIVKYEHEISLNEKSTKFSDNTETVDTIKEEQKVEKHNVCTVMNIDTEDNNAQCQALIKSLSHTFENKDQSLHVRDTDTDLSKLVDNSSEVVVLTVETEENIVVTLHENDVTLNSNENSLSRKAQETKKGDIVNEEFDLIDYSQESEGTIIEVISTEVVQSENSETCSNEVKKENSEDTAADVDPVTSSTSDIVTKPQIVDNVNINEDKIQEKCNANKENDIGQIQIKTNDKVKTETCDNLDNNIKEEVIHSNIIIAPIHVDNSEKESISVHEIDNTDATIRKRSVIQDIFDDWGDENVDDTETDNQSESKVQDTVEIELKSLLDDTKAAPTIEKNTVVLLEEEITCIEKTPVTDNTNIVEIAEGNTEQQISKEHADNNQTVNKKQQSAVKLLNKDQVNFIVSSSIGKSTKNTLNDSLNQASPQTKVMPIVNRGRSLTSRKASEAEVTEVLKERFREKQKFLEAPPGPDIFFVKKLTQRLSSKLAGGPLPALIPLPQSTTQSPSHSEKKVTDNAKLETNKESNSDNKELLAILEGDVDPDWSNLKPPTLVPEEKIPENVQPTDQDISSKLDPLVERELALKQLLELPVTPVKKNISKKKKVYKPMPSKTPKEVEITSKPVAEKEIANITLIDATAESAVKNTRPDSEPFLTIIEHHTSEKSTESFLKDTRLDESRSGRKRKLTERAREHEEQQSIVKRQKVYKSKIPLNKKPDNEVQTVVDTNKVTENHVSKENTSPIDIENDETDITITKEIIKKQVTDKTDPVPDTPENISLKRSKQSVNKKGSQSIAKKSIPVKKILKQNISNNSKKSIALKAKLSTSPKKSGSKVVSKSKRSAESSTGDPKPKKKIINEIDRLLQDEGVVNLLYDVEQPDKKRLIPITKSQTKVMDIQKVQRELKLRKKLVRNAVLRLRTSTSGASKVSSRSKRSSIQLNDSQSEKKVGEQTPTAKSTNAQSQPEFILPAKIRNAADASIIVRRHSSSSFSSASGSPRVSIDSPDKIEGAKIDEGGSHSLRSTKRKHSPDEKTNTKKSKKKSIQKIDGENIVSNAVEDKTKPKKSDSKKGDKNSKQLEEVNEANNTSDKVITRSNGTTTGKIALKNKKVVKSKVTFAKTNETDNNEEFSKGEDELSAVLAEAANALSVVSAGNRSGNSTANRKNKANANITKISELDNNKTRADTRSQFNNKEITVRRHGNLVQLILTPSSSTKIRNALTLQVMQEFRETLSILKKDDGCRVVLLTSTGSSFCEGLELSMLLNVNKEERRVRAQEMADAVKDFIKSLASFNKPIVAGVQGATVGLGVTMLPLFDFVIASDKATFSTPYGKLGQIAEGAAVFTLSHILGSAITSELLLGGRTLTANEALRAGLITRVLWPDRFQVELLPTLKAMSEQSSQSMEATKALLRHTLRKKLDAALESETYLLIQHWCSTECQTAIKAYIDGKVQ